ERVTQEQHTISAWRLFVGVLAIPEAVRVDRNRRVIDAAYDCASVLVRNQLDADSRIPLPEEVGGGHEPANRTFERERAHHDPHPDENEPHEDSRHLRSPPPG